MGDGSFGVGQVVLIERKATGDGLPYVALFSTRLSEVKDFEKIKSNLENSDNQLLSVLMTPGTQLTDGLWPIVGAGVPRNIEKYISIQLLRENNYIGEKSYTAGILVNFLEAYHGLKPWDMYFEPDFFDKLLISPDKKPNNLVYSKKK